MRKIIAEITGIFLLISIGAPAVAENTQAVAVVNKMLERDAARRAGVDSYIVTENHSTGTAAVLLYEKMSDELGYRMVFPDEIQKRAIPNYGEAMEAYGPKLMQVANSMIWYGGLAAVGSGVVSIKQANEAGGAINDALRAKPREWDDRAAAEQNLKDMREFASMANGVDRVEYLGQDAFYIVADNIEKKQVTEEGEFTFRKVALWIDAKKYLLLGMNVYGTSKTPDSKKPDPFEVHLKNEDYRAVGNSQLLIPYKVGMGVRFDFLSKKEKKEQEKAKKDMEKAMKEYEKFKKQMENASPQERAMMETMMKSMGMGNMEEQMRMAENMYKGEPISSYTNVTDTRIGGLKEYLTVLGVIGNN